MSAVWSFLSRTHGHRRLSWVDWASYAYLLIGVLVILLPVLWIGLNSVKSQTQLEKNDLSLLPSDFVRVARGTIHDESGKRFVILQNLPDWVLTWGALTDEERAALDPEAIVNARSNDEYYILRSHLGLVDQQARALIADQGLPSDLLKWRSLGNAAKADLDLPSLLGQLAGSERRLLLEFLGEPPFKPNKLIAQILVTAPHPETGAIEQFAVSSITSRSDSIAGRSVDGDPSKVWKLDKNQVQASRIFQPAWRNYLEPLSGNANGVQVNFAQCFANSMLVTVLATLLTLLINSMAAFALSKYQFRGQRFFFVFILATLMVPPTITLVGVFKMISATGLSGSLWGVIIPGAATPAGVFLLRQYMLSIPDELIEAARMDAASEWKIYWKIIVPLALPAIAALGILSIIWRWNDLILPLVAIATSKEAYTIQLCLLEFSGEHVSQEHFRLAMTVVSLIPTTLVFVFLQRYITTGIASTGVK